VGGITVYEVEARNMKAHHRRLLQNGIPHREGACAFLDSKECCRIYEDRPYVCRTQGYPLRWLEERDEGQVVEMRDICPLNDPGEPLETLPVEACWTIGPFEERLARLQCAVHGGQMIRIELRDLFRKGSSIKA
jgi:Fe-S-cluster containining protein